MFQSRAYKGSVNLGFEVARYCYQEPKETNEKQRPVDMLYIRVAMLSFGLLHKCYSRKKGIAD